MGSVQVGFYGHVRQYHNLKDEIAAVVHEVLESGSYVMGPRLKQFEKELAECCRAKETVGVNSGTDALWLAFMALGIGPGDEVITTSNSFFGTAEAIWIAGATAVFVDCDPKTCNIDTSLINDHARHHQRATLHPRSHSAAAGGAGARSSRGKYSPPHRGVSQDHNGNARALEVLLRYPKRRAGFREFRHRRHERGGGQSPLAGRVHAGRHGRKIRRALAGTGAGVWRGGGHPSVIATPHIAGSTEEAQEIVGIRIAEQVRDFLITGVARNSVNIPAVSPKECKKLEPHIQLGEKSGAFLAQVAMERIREVRISYDGGLAELNTHLVKSAVLKGILKLALSERVNLINAGALAKQRGLEVFEVRSARRATFSNSLGIGITTEGESASGVGMVGPRSALRILGLNEIDIDAPLRGTIILIRNQDVAGVIGRVGTILGDRKINIVTFTLSRNPQTQQAIGLVNVDNHVPDEVLREIRVTPAVRAARVVEV